MKKIIVLIMLCLVPVVCWAEDDIVSIGNVEEAQGIEAGKEDARDILIRDVLEFSGMKKQIEQYPGIVQQELNQQGKGKDPEIYAVVNKIIIESFSAEAIYQELLNKIKEDFDEKNLKIMLEFFKSPLAKKIVNLEIEANDPEHHQDLEDFAIKLQSNPPAQERVALLKRLAAAADSIDFSVEVAIQLNSDIMKIFSDLEEKKLNAEEIQRYKNELRSNLKGSIENSWLIVSLYTYQPVPDEEIKQYTVFYESETGQWFGKLLKEAFIGAFATIGEKISSRLTDVLEAKKTN